MKIGLHVVLSNAESNIVTTLQHTGVTYPTRTVLHYVEIEVPNPPQGFAIDRITIAADQNKAAPKFANVSCSQCGQEFGPGDHGFSHCENHKGHNFEVSGLAPRKESK